MAILLGSTLFSFLGAAESEPKSTEGIERIQLVTDVSAILPGEEITVGLLLKPRPGFHTYWRGPGVVGVATVLEWKLPKGFSAGPIEWPLPEKVDMVGISANGYRREVCLLTRIQIPSAISTDTVSLDVRCAWMACSSICHPGMQDLTLTLPVAKSKDAIQINQDLRERFQSVRNSQPTATPTAWKVTPTLAGKNQIDLEIDLSSPLPGDDLTLQFFADDLQVDSDSPMKFQWIDREAGHFQLSFVRPDFAPKNPPRFSGLLFIPDGLPGIDSKWVEISVPWPKGTFPDE